MNALQTEINQMQGNPTVVTQGKTPLLTKATGYELGVRSEPVPDFKLEGALFVLNLASEATFDGDEAMTTPGRPSQRKGIELSASYKPFPWLRLDDDFAATHARYVDGDPGTGDTEPGHPGSCIPNAANMIATAGATVEDLGPWFGAFEFRYFGRRPLIEDDSVTSKPTTLVDLRVGYKFSEQARVWLDIFNLFNTPALIRSIISTPRDWRTRRRRCTTSISTGRAGLGPAHPEHVILTERHQDRFNHPRRVRASYFEAGNAHRNIRSTLRG